MAVPLHRAAHGVHVPATLFWMREEMKHGPIMPYIKKVTWELNRHDVSLDPSNRSSTRAKALPRKLKRSSNDIKYCNVLIALREKFIHEAGSPPAHIYNLSCLAGSCPMDQFQRSLWVLFVPTKLGRIERVVNSLPMRLGIHSFPTGNRLPNASSLYDVLL
jgi:hypothetical protein